MADFEPKMVGARIVTAASFLFMTVCLIGLGVGQWVGWGIAFCVSILTIFLAVSFYGLSQLLTDIERNSFRTTEALDRLSKRIEDVSERLEKVNDSILLNEEAKTIAFRDKDLTAMRIAAEEKISACDWEGANSLIDKMESQFDAREQANKLRKQIVFAQDELSRNELNPLLVDFETHLEAFEWNLAIEVLETIQKRFPEVIANERLSEKIEQHRTDRKKYLIQQWDAAIQKEEVDRGIEVLKELDQYLTPNEAAALEESARGAFRAKLHNMGVQFSLLVTEKVWDRALTLGQEIIREFPNSRMAMEIQEGLAGLEAKANAIKKENEVSV